MTFTVRTQTQTAERFHMFDGRQLKPFLPAFFQDRMSQRVFAALFQRTCMIQCLFWIVADDREDDRLSYGQRTGLIQQDRIDLTGVFQRFSALHEDAELGGLAASDHDGRRGG